MKKNIIKTFFFAFVILTGPKIYGDEPKQSPIITFLNKTYSDWKEKTHLIADDMGIIEYVPSNQNPENWSELISLQYAYGLAMFKNPVEDTLNLLKQVAAIENHTNDVRWNVIEKSDHHAIFEVIVYGKEKGVILKHELSRMSITKNGFSRATFTEKNKEISDAEKQKWMKDLLELIEVIPSNPKQA